MTTKILLVNSEKSFLADYTKQQPIEPIIKECYRQFKIPVPEDLSKAKLYQKATSPSGRIFLDQTDFNKRFGDYILEKDGELIFES